MPLAFNWQSGVFSVPALVGYLVPRQPTPTPPSCSRSSSSPGPVCTCCAGCCGLGPLAAAFGGTAFELSGPMIVHAGWPHTSVTCWAGWMLAAAVGLLRGTHRLRNVILLAVAVGLAVYGGHPESLVVLGLAVVVFVVVFLVARARTTGGAGAPPAARSRDRRRVRLRAGRPVAVPRRPAGLLSARRRNGTGAPAFPLSHVPNLLAVGLQGNDFRTAAYVGVVVLALAVVGTQGVVAATRGPALAAVAVVTPLLTFFSPADQILHLVPGGRTVAWSRAVMLLALALAVLAAIGLDALVATDARTATAVHGRRGPSAPSAVVVLGLARGRRVGLAPAIDRHRASLVWPAVQALVGLALAGAVVAGGRAGAHSPRPGRTALARWGPALLLALETGFLLSAGIPFWSVSSTYFPTNPAITALQQTVGPSLVGYGSVPVAALPHGVQGRGGHPAQRQHRLRRARDGGLRPHPAGQLLPGVVAVERQAHSPCSGTARDLLRPASPPSPKPGCSGSGTSSSRPAGPAGWDHPGRRLRRRGARVDPRLRRGDGDPGPGRRCALPDSKRPGHRSR